MNILTHAGWRLDRAGLLVAVFLIFPLPAFAADDADLLADALAAAWPGMVDDVAVMDWNGKMLREGSNGYTCLPTPPTFNGIAPMCMDSVWMQWADAWQNKKDFSADKLAVAYMLGGDSGASNTDPYATKSQAGTDWIVEGAHLMIIVPSALLEAFPTDPHNGGPYVMWKGTPYAHVMVPISKRPAQ